MRCFTVLLGVGTAVASFAQAPVDISLRPDDNRFTPVALTQPGALDEPLVFEVLPDGRAAVTIGVVRRAARKEDARAR